MPVEVLAKWEQGFGPLLIKDTTHHLERMLAQASGKTVEISWEQARMKIEDAIDSYIYLNRANARGDVWYALGKVTACAAELYTLLATLRGSRAYNNRYAEQVLSLEEQAGLDPLRLAGSRTPSWSFFADPGECHSERQRRICPIKRICWRHSSALATIS